MSLWVPYTRELHQGHKGKDVVAVQRALKKVGVRKKNATGSYGKGTVLNVKNYQKREGIKVDGVYGRDTHLHMMRDKGFDQYGAMLMQEAANSQKEVGVRSRLKVGAMWGYTNRGSIHYTQGPLRMYGVRNKIRIPGIPIWEDCSSFVTWVYWQAGARDPNGLAYSGFGFTGTQIENGTRLRSILEAQVGDLLFYGPSSSVITHVTIFVGDGRVVSHGSESGPNFGPYGYRSDFRFAISYL
jgi:peptidoglycan hydrolase-like protein with peptidoglycan-binding domain